MRSDIPELARYFLQQAAATKMPPVSEITPEALQFLTRQLWLGNARELKHSIETAMLFCQGNTLGMEALQTVCGGGTSSTTTEPIPLADLERLHIIQALEYYDGKVLEAARQLGISKSKLYNKIEKYGLKG